MGMLNADHPGLAYGDGKMSGPGSMGQLVKLVGNDTFSVNTDPDIESFGMLKKDYQDGELPGIWCNGGVYTTDIYEGTINNDDELRCSGNGMLAAGVSGSQKKVGKAISVIGGVLKFKLTI